MRVCVPHEKFIYYSNQFVCICHYFIHSLFCVFLGKGRRTVDSAKTKADAFLKIQGLLKGWDPLNVVPQILRRKRSACLVQLRRRYVN